jgi:hypothetical protein
MTVADKAVMGSRDCSEVGKGGKEVLDNAVELDGEGVSKRETMLASEEADDGSAF